MKPKIITLCLLLFFCLTWQTAASQTWKELLDQADSLSDAANYDSAIVIGQMALEKAEKEFGAEDTSVALVLHRMGVYYYYKGDYDLAESLIKRGLAIREKALGSDNPDVAASLNNLATLYCEQGKYAEAELLHKRVLAIMEKALGPDHTDVASSLNNLGVLYRRQGRYAEAESLYKRALAIREKALGPEHPYLAVSLGSLASVYHNQGKYTEAEPLYKRALAIFGEALGPDHPNVAFILNNLAGVCQNQGKYTEAEHLHRRALAIREKALGPEHPEVAASLNNLALLYKEQGKYAEAELLYKRALAIREKALGPDHPLLATTLNNLGLLHREQGKYTEAEPLYKRALAVLEKALGPDHPDVASTLNNLANLYQVQRKYAEAELLYKRALAIKEKALGPEHPNVASSLNNLGILCFRQGKYAEAELLHRRALAISEKALGPNHPDVARNLNNLADLYQEQGKYAEAELLYKRALAIKEKALGPDHPLLATSLKNLAALYCKRGRYTEAEPLFKRAQTIGEKALGRDHPEVAEILESFSEYFRLQADSKRGLEMAERAFEIRKKNFRDGSSVMSEKDALTYSQFMRNSASNFLSAYFDSGIDENTLDYAAADVMFSTKGQASEAIFIRAREIIMLDQLGALADSLRYARSFLSKLYVEGVGEEDPGSYRERLDKASHDKERFESELARTNVTYRDLQAALGVNAKKVVDVLNIFLKRSTLIEYMQYDYVSLAPDTVISHYLAVVLSGSGEIFVKDLGEASGIDSLINQYRRHLLNVSSSGRFPTIVEQIDYEKISKALYDKVWRPVEKQISKIDLVFIAPDGGLNMVSFAGLMGQDGKYLIEKYPIHYLSSGRDLIRLKDEAEPGLGLFALGDPDYNATAFARLSIPEGMPPDSLPEVDYYSTRNVRSGCGELKDMTVSPLPWTRSEVEKIAESFQKSLNESVVAYFGADASEEHFKSEAPGNRVIHLATHGYFIQGKCQVELSKRGFGLEESYVGENPLLLSGLFLAGANLHGEGADSLGAEDGILTAEEVTAMNLDGTELVVLSACETGLGEVKEGEGVYGLRRAFQMAGARTVISALWPVSDKATAEMMSKLYERKIESLPERIRKLQLERINQLRNQEKPDHPFSWGAFIALGDWR